MKRLPCCPVIHLLLCLIFFRPGLCLAQDSPDSEGEPDDLLRQGITAYENGAFQRAFDALKKAIDLSSTAYHKDYGSASFWLGSTLLALDQPEALLVWEQGWDQLRQAGIVDLRLADTYIWNIFERRDSTRYEKAVTVYEALMQEIDGTQVPEGLRKRYLVPLSFILPEPLRLRYDLTDPESIIKDGIPDGSGTRLLTEWRHLDIFPATLANEVLTEHLERITYAGKHYADTRTITGLDDRGLIYIKLGPPGKNTSVYFNEFDYISTLPNPAFPENELWVYRGIDSAVHYLFVRKVGKPYRIGLPADLIPSELRLQSKANILLVQLEDIYEKLTLYNPGTHYVFIYNKIADFIMDLEMSRFAEGLSQRSSRTEIIAFAQSILAEAGSRDRVAVNERERIVPATYSNLLDELEPLPVQMRWARFLDDAGGTRIEVYWTIHADLLHPSRRMVRRLKKEGHEPSDSVLIETAIVQQSREFLFRTHQIKRHLLHLPEERRSTEWVVPVQTVIVEPDTAVYHLALQWDEYWARESAETEGRISRGAKLKTGTYRIDSLQALNTTSLEMSDLKPLRITDGGLDSVTPFPHQAITPDIPLVLYFEIYRLMPASDGYTRYSVAYRITRLDKRGKQTGRQTTSESHYTGNYPTAKEQILVDFSTLEGPGSVEITVEVTDETNGQSVERSMRFELLP